MKKLIFLLCVCFMCSCSVFRKSTKTDTRSELEIKSGSVSAKTETDTSKTVMTEKIRISFPLVPDGKIPAGFPWPALNDGTSDLREATRNLSEQFKGMLDKYNTSKKQLGDYNELKESYKALLSKYADDGSDKTLELEIDRKFSDQAYKYNADRKADSTQLQQNIQSTVKAKDGISPWYGIAALVIIIVAFRLTRKI